MNIHLYQYDLPSHVIFDKSVAIDTEAMGLKPHRDRLCVVQLGDGAGNCHLVHFPTPDYDRAINLKNLLQRDDLLKIFHFARFDLMALYKTFGIMPRHIFCTKVASFLTRTYSNRHSLKDLCKELLDVEISKQEQTSDWGAPNLSSAQQKYAASDVLYLHQLHQKLNSLLLRENRLEMAQACFDFLPTRARLDFEAGENFDVFAHVLSNA